MASISGDDQNWQMSGYGVLGTATPRTAPTQDGPVDVDSYGVWGILGTKDDVANIVDEVTSNTPFVFQRTAILGRNALPDQGSAIYGESRPDLAPANSFGFIAGRSPYAGEVTGVFGQATQRGVIGIATDPLGIGVYGGSVGGAAVGVFGDSQAQQGVLGRTATGVGVQGECGGDPNDPNFKGLAGRFVGNVEVTGDVRLTGQDVAEEFELSGISRVEPGTVMVIGEDGSVRPSSAPYDKRVAGVVSGAGTCKPALVLNKMGSTHPTAPLALVGRAFCKVTVGHHPIEIGDLLTTSEIPGHAMRAADPVKSFGSVIGKALAPLGEGAGLIPILIALQ